MSRKKIWYSKQKHTVLQGEAYTFSLFFRKEALTINVLDRKKILDFMTLRKAALDNQLIRDFSGSISEKVAEQREVKYWKEAIERGEFDTELQEVYVILSQTQPEIVDFTFYTDLETVANRVDELNKLAKNRYAYWFITMYSNSRNSGNLVEGVERLAD